MRCGCEGCVCSENEKRGRGSDGRSAPPPVITGQPGTAALWMAWLSSDMSCSYSGLDRTTAAGEVEAMALSKPEINALYRKRARNYDLSANLYYLLGFRETHYRKRAVACLGLSPGDTVVEIGCGTGLNFGHLQDALGGQGKIIGVDLTDAMLEQAENRIRRNGWTNVELVHADAATFDFPDTVQGIISSFAITLVPEYDTIIRRASEALGPKGRMVILDLKLPEDWPRWLVKLGVMITRPFGVTLDLSSRQPWRAMETHFSSVTVRGLFGGFAFIAVGQNSGAESDSFRVT